MDALDSPISLTFNNGNNFPSNFKFIAWIMLVVSLFFTFIGLLAAAFGVFVLFFLLSFACLMAITNQNIVEINDEKNFIYDYNLFLGFIKKGKKYPLDKYKYITNMPLIQSEQVYASSSNFINISHNYFTIALFGERFRGKRIITMLDSKAEAIEKATKLAERLRPFQNSKIEAL